MTNMTDLNINSLAMCAIRMAEAMDVTEPPIEDVVSFLSNLVLSKDIAVNLKLGLITDIEARDLVMAHVTTWLSTINNILEPSCDFYFSRILELDFEIALFGRALHS
jgi:hypothetical protein